MAVGRFSETNLFLDGTITGGTTWSSALPLANLLTEEDYVGAPARCLDAGDLFQSWFEVVLPEPRTFSLVALFFHSLSLNARMRVRAAELEDAAYAAPVLDSGWDWVFPSLYDPEELEFGLENFWAGTVTEGELDLFKRHKWFPVEETLAQRIRIDLDDQENPDGFFDIGGAFATSGFSPEINFDRGRELTVNARDLIDEAPSGRRFPEKRPPRRVLSCSYSTLEDAEARRFVDAAMRSTTTGTVVFIPDLDDPAALMREAFPATFGKLPGARITWPGLAQAGFTLEEILA